MQPNPALSFGSIDSIKFINNGSGGVQVLAHGLPSDGAWLSMEQNCFDITCEKVIKLPNRLVENDMTCNKCLECCEYKNLNLEFYRYMGYTLEVYTPDYISEFYELFSLYLKEKYNFSYTSANLEDFEKNCTDQGYCINLDTSFAHLRFTAMNFGNQWMFFPFCPPSPEPTPCIDSNLVISNCLCENDISSPEGAIALKLCDKSLYQSIPYKSRCREKLEIQAEYLAQKAYTEYIDSVKHDFKTRYLLSKVSELIIS